MGRNARSFALFVVLGLAAGTAIVALPAPGGPITGPVAPKTPAIEVKELIQGTEIIDPYRWLEDQDSAETRSWITQQNAYTDSLLSGLPQREKLKQQLNALLKIDVTGAPTVRKGRYFFARRLAGQEQYVYYMRKGLQGKDEILLDPLPLSPDHTISFALNSVSLDGSLLVYSSREGGQDELTPHLFNVETRKNLPDAFPKGRYGPVCMLPDKSGMYFSRLTAEGPRIFFHKIGADSAGDQEIFGKGNGPDRGIGCEVSQDGRYLSLFVTYGSNQERTDVYVQDMARKGPIVPIVNDLTASFAGFVLNGKMYLRTNWKAVRGRVIEVDLKNPAREHWRELIPESEAILDGFSLVGGKIAVHLTQNVVPHVKLFDLNGRMIREVTPPALGTMSGMFGPQHGHEAFYTVSSFHLPPTIYRYDLATGEQHVWSQLNVPIETAKYEVHQVWYTSKDGTKIPMFLAHAKGIKLDGSNPTLLTGYGGFNLSSFPSYSAMAAAWMANGGVYALVNLRGGGEFGEEWHRAGMLEKKQNVFDDFISAAEWLVQNKYTNPGRLAIRGGSNGGLLVGAALTQRPDLFAAVICTYPLLDMVRYHKFLVAKYWVNEYGSADDPAQFKYIYDYSPYHHVKAGTKYPAVFLISGDSDTRVAPLHARKMTALLQAATASDKPIMLRYETKAGHTNGLPLSQQVDNMAEEMAFLMWQLGMGE